MPRLETSEPASHEAEQAVLGAALLSPAAATAVTEELSLDDFAHHRHRLIAAAIRTIRAAGAVVDLRTVQAELERQGKLDAAGGLPYLAELDLNLPDVTRFADYVAILRDRTTRRRLLALGRDLVQQAPAEPLADLLAATHQQLTRLESQAAAGAFAHLSSGLAEVCEVLDRPGGELPGLTTGLPGLDNLILGLEVGKLYVLGGRPGMGKSALAGGIAAHLAIDREEPAAVISLEMGQREYVERLLADRAGIRYEAIRKKLLSAYERRLIAELTEDYQRSPLYIDDTAGASISSIRSRVRRLTETLGRPPALVVVDYLQLLTAEGRHENRTTAVGAMSRGLKQLARELPCSVLALSQLTRRSEDRPDGKPTMADLRESGDIEADADVVILVWRPDGQSTTGELIVPKNRAGSPGVVPVAYNGSLLRFRELITHATHA